MHLVRLKLRTRILSHCSLHNLRSRYSFLFVLAIVATLFSTAALAQLDSATLAGHVVDSSGRAIQGARITLINVDNNTQMSRRTGKAGSYVFPDISPGLYRVEISASGFSTAAYRNLTLNTADTIQHNFTLLALSEPASVGGNGSSVRTSGAVSTIVDRALVEDLPLNGRSFQTLFQLTPGVVITPTSFASQGQFSVNGQRTDSNYFLVDGVSANFGISFGANPGQSVGGSLPALTALGGTNSLVSTNDVQEFAILTSSFAPEFGRTPGGQISVVTRSGTNEIHGELFDYLRNDALDANDWFANQHNLPRAALRQNDFGGVVGGPIRKDKSFFFFSYEGLQLRQPTIGESDVPSRTARGAATPSIKPFFNAYPLPNGPDEGNGLAPATYAFSDPSTLNTSSLRIDQHFGEGIKIFGRYNNSASEQKLRGANLSSLSSVTDLHSALQTMTIGLTWSMASQVTNDARINWSVSSTTFNVATDNFEGANPLIEVVPAPFTEKNSLFEFVPALTAQHPDLEIGSNTADSQAQVNVIDVFTIEAQGHTLKAGADVRILRPYIRPPIYQEQALFTGIPAAMNGSSLLSIVGAFAPVHSYFANWSVFIQDTWRPSRRLTLTYGLRWEVNPAPSAQGSGGLLPVAVVGFQNLETLSLAPPASKLFRVPTTNLAPRVGFSYELRTSARSHTEVKAGAGVFYDLDNGFIGDLYSGTLFPFSGEKVLTGAPFPLSPSNAAPPGISTAPPVPQIVAFPPLLRLPYTYQWNLSVDQSLGSGDLLSVSYVGSAGHRLLRTEQFVGGEVGVPTSFQQILFTANGGYSNYNALEAQFRHSAKRGLDLVASYTYSHSLDNVSTDSFFVAPAPLIDPRKDYGSSDFDIRHTVTMGLSYTSSVAAASPTTREFLSNWRIDPILLFRSSPPIDVVLLSNVGVSDFFLRPDLNSGTRLYIHDQSAPGGVRLNPAAFAVPVTPRQGDLGRNALRGFSLFQFDLALQRRFRVKESLWVQVGIDSFNIFNHPNFAPEAGQLGVLDTTGHFTAQNGFGISPSTLASGLQTGGPGSGFSPLYQIGQARTLQVSLRLQF